MIEVAKAGLDYITLDSVVKPPRRHERTLADNALRRKRGLGPLFCFCGSPGCSRAIDDYLRGLKHEREPMKTIDMVFAEAMAKSAPTFKPEADYVFAAMRELDALLPSSPD